MNNKTLVKITADEAYLSFRTITRERKSPHSFMISKFSVSQLLTFGTVVCESDSGSFVQMWQDKLSKTVRCRFFWLHSDGFRLSGWEQTIILPFWKLMDFNDKSEKGCQWKVLSLEEPQRPKLVFSAASNLHEIVSNPVVRRKLSHFLRDNFQWRDTQEIHFYDDSTPYSFFFREMNGERTGLCGGLILHGQDDLKKAQYAIHT